MNNPSLQNRIEKQQGGLKFPYNTPLTPPYSRLEYSYNDESWIPAAAVNNQSNCKGGLRVQNRVDLLNWTLELSSVSLILNLETNKISLDGTEFPCNIEKGYCHPTALTKATLVWEPEVHCKLFETIRFDAYTVKYGNRY